MPGRECERNAERHGTDIVDFHLPGHSDNASGAIRLAHGFVEQGGNDAAMRVSGGAGKTFAEPRMADDGSGVVDKEPQAQAGAILLSAAETVVQRAMGERSQMRLLSRIRMGHECGTSLRGSMTCDYRT